MNSTCPMGFIVLIRFLSKHNPHSSALMADCEVFFMSINIFKIFNIWSIRNCLVLNKRWIGVNTPSPWGNYAI